MTAWTIQQGRTLTLPVEWRSHEGGPLVAVTGVTIEIVPIAGGAAVVGPTSTGVTSAGTGLNAYRWEVPADQDPGEYYAIWTATDGDSEEIPAVDTVTVQEYIPVPGAYATLTDLNDVYGSTPAGAAMLLVRASRDVDRALLTSVYPVDDNGLPTTAAHITALRDATVEQAIGNLDAGNRSGTGAAPRRSGFTIGKLSVQQASGAGGASGALVDKIGPLWSQAWQVLQSAGLTGHGPQTW
ncbi:hypothetical protein O7627_24400 [Solwaraspora sp. WMMD1047]|uniref:hypothetical protein n=1 Tax=Solwaraspora sp. WMMD1047 TaxID=3016102 RepID=UPI0024170DBA|nr:hypothetical protein [Solwaraspora sp. WMMD1047]MDG4832425.1 hypothetical protein [Solwaraspora sp. WMMD1047]